MSPDHRIDPREAVSLPVQLDGGSVGMTRDISASGVFLETDIQHQVGSRIDLEIALETPGGPIHLKAVGQVVRVDQKGARVGLAIRLVDSQLV